MNIEELYKKLIKDFNLEDLEDEDKEEMLFEISKTIQKQFLLDVYEEIGEKDFEALEASVSMGEEFYETTLKHLVPNYEEIFEKSREKVINNFKSK